MRKKIYKEIKTLRENNTFRVIMVVLALFAGPIISRTPYVNLVFTSQLTPFLLTLIILWLWQMSPQKILLIALGLFVPTFLLFVIGQPDYAELLGNYTFGLLIMGIIGFLGNLK